MRSSLTAVPISKEIDMPTKRTKEKQEEKSRFSNNYNPYSFVAPVGKAEKVETDTDANELDEVASFSNYHFEPTLYDDEEIETQVSSFPFSMNQKKIFISHTTSSSTSSDEEQPIFDFEEPELNQSQKISREQPTENIPEEKPTISPLIIARKLTREGKPLSTIINIDDIEAGVINGEYAPLVPQQQGWYEWTRTKIANAAAYAYDTALSTPQYALDTAYSTAHYVNANKAKTFLACISATTFSLNAFNNALQDGKWGNSTYLQCTHAVANFMSSFTINTIMNTFMLSTIWERFVDMLKHTFDGPKEFLCTCISLGIGVGGMIALSMVTLDVYHWLGEIAAWIPVIINAVPTALLPRTLGALNTTNALSNLSKADARAQAQFADALLRINDKYLHEINNELDAVLAKKFENRSLEDLLTNDEIQEIAGELATILAKFAKKHKDLIDEKTYCESTYQWALLMTDLTSGCLLGLAAYLTYMQKGFDGFSLIAKYTTGSDLTVLDDWIKRGIGVVPGLATGLLYGSYGLKIRGTLFELLTQLYHNPQEIPRALTLFIANSLAASGPQNVAAGVIKRPKNISFFHSADSGSSTFVGLNYAGGWATNGDSVFKKFCLPNKTPITLTISDIQNHASKVNDNLVNESTAAKFKLFNKKINKNPESENTKVERQRFAVVI